MQWRHRANRISLRTLDTDLFGEVDGLELQKPYAKYAIAR